MEADHWRKWKVPSRPGCYQDERGVETGFPLWNKVELLWTKISWCLFQDTRWKNTGGVSFISGIHWDHSDPLGSQWSGLHSVQAAAGFIFDHWRLIRQSLSYMFVWKVKKKCIQDFCQEPQINIYSTENKMTSSSRDRYWIMVSDVVVIRNMERGQHILYFKKINVMV